MISFYSKETINYDSKFNLDEKIFNNLYGKIYKGAINVVDISNDTTKESIIEAKGQIINNDRALFMIRNQLSNYRSSIKLLLYEIVDFFIFIF